MKRIHILIIPAILFMSCSSLKVISDVDDTEDFTQFKTYEFAGWIDDSDKYISRFDRDRITSAFKLEAQKRGLSQVEKDADILVALYVVSETRTQTSAHTTTMHTGAMMGPRGMRGPGWGWGTGHSTTTISETDYQVGTLMVEVFDVEEKKLIWQAIGTKTISENPQKRAKEISGTVNAMMRKYPVKPLK